MIEDLRMKYSILENLVNSQPGSLRQHVHNVALLSERVARLYGCDPDCAHRIYLGCLLHDIGKQFLSPTVLHKRDMLDRGEISQLRRHPELGYRYLSHFISDGEILSTILYHHEYWDGSGYPYGLKHGEISLGARICAVADVWDALTSDRCYRRAWSPFQACDFIWASAGSHFDREIAFLFLDLIEQLSVSGSIRDEDKPETVIRPASRIRLLDTAM